MIPETVEVGGTTYVRAYPVAPGHCAACGHGRMVWTPARIIEAAQTFHTHHGRPPKTVDWKNAGHGHPARSTVQMVFGSWRAMLAAAGYAAGVSNGYAAVWTRDRVAEAMLDQLARTGKWPTCREWQRAAPEGRSPFSRTRPTYTTVITLFGTWNDAKRFAGWGVPADDRDSMIDAGPLTEALRLAESAELDGIAEAADVSADYLYRLKRGGFARVRLSFADRILTAMDRPDVLAAAA